MDQKRNRVVWKSVYSEPKNIKIKSNNDTTNYSLNRKLVDFIEWFSIYNMIPVGLALKMVIGSNNNFLKKITNQLSQKSQNKKIYFEQRTNICFKIS